MAEKIVPNALLIQTLRNKEGSFCAGKIHSNVFSLHGAALKYKIKMSDFCHSGKMCANAIILSSVLSGTILFLHKIQVRINLRW